MKKAVLFLSILTVCVSLGAQSLADLARTEKARRESYRGRHAVVIRSEDLMRVQKVPAVEVIRPEGEPTGAFETEGQPVEPGTASAAGEAANPQPGLSVPAMEPPAAEQSAPGTRAGANIALEAQLSAARELVDLLTLKMSALRQQYEHQDAMIPGYVIQEQLAETEKRLLKAQSQLARIEAQAKK